MCIVCDELHRGGAPASIGRYRPTQASAGLETGGGPSDRVMPQDSGVDGRRILIRCAAILSMDPGVGDFAQGDILIEGKTIKAVAAHIDAGDAAVIDARGMIVTPGFVDTHHHQFETALRGLLADSILIDDGQPHGANNYYETVLQRFAAIYEPDDVYISEVAGSLSQLDAGVTTVMDVSQIHHSPDHSDAAVAGLEQAGRRSVLGYFEGGADKASYPGDARRLKAQYCSSDDQLLTMVMGGEIYLPWHEEAWAIGRELAIPVALHVVGTFGMAPTFDALAQAGKFGPDNIFIHMTGMSELGWKAAADAGAHVSLSVPIEMQMRHGAPPIQKCLDLGLQPSLSTDVECTMTADFFTQMRSAMTLQRMAVNEAALAGQTDTPAMLTSKDVLRFATLEGARGLKLDHKVGSITPGKEADLILLDAEAINVMPLNSAAGAVVTLMERSNVDTVLVAGKIRKWAGRLVDVNLSALRRRLADSRDELFQRAGVSHDLLR